MACIAQKRNAHRVLVQKPEGKKPLARSRHRNTILEWIFKKQDGRAQTALIWLSQKTQCDLYAAQEDRRTCFLFLHGVLKSAWLHKSWATLQQHSSTFWCPQVRKVFSLIHLFKKASHIFKCNLFISGKVLCSVLTNLENIYLCTHVCFFFVRSVEQPLCGYG